MRSPIAMISYSWDDAAAAELLHDELALRCFEVIHDRHSFTAGSRIPSNMASGVETCDVFLAYLTPRSLYLDRTPDSPRPALEGELIPALQRRRRNLGTGGSAKPLLILLSHGLGDRSTASETVRRLTGEQIDSFWGTWLDQESGHIAQAEAARVADGALRALLQQESPAAPIELSVVTRGTAPAAHRFTIDGTRLFGGERRSGDPADWARFRAALQSVADLLASASGGGEIRIELACHLSAALAVGRTFHQATRWKPIFLGRHGESKPVAEGSMEGLTGGLDHISNGDDLIVDIDLIGHDVMARADRLAAELSQPAVGRLSLARVERADLSPEEISRLARATADRIRGAYVDLRSTRIHIVTAAPAAYVALLGHHLTALQADLHLYEPNSGGYIRAMELPQVIP